MDPLVDLVTGTCCTGCAAPGRLLCPGCAASLDGAAGPVRPTPCPEGLADCRAAGEYAGLLRDLVLGHKEHARFGLRRPLGRLLAAAVAGLVPPGPVLLVPVPSRAATVRARGHDPTYALTAAAARHLRRQSYDARAARLLRVGRVRDQAGLDAAERAANLAGSMHCPSALLRRVSQGTPDGAPVVLCDDVLTTGATAREAQRALAASGVLVAGIATVAATRKRATGSQPSLRVELLGPTD